MSNAAPGKGGGGSGDNSLRFFLLFEVNDEAATKGLKKIVDAISNLKNQTGHLDAETAATGGHVSNMADSLQHYGERLTGYGERGIHMLEGMGDQVLHNAAHFEELGRRIEFAYGAAGSDAAYQRIQQFAVDSVYSLSDITTAAVSLRTAFNGIDLSADQDRFLARNGQMVTALEAFSDAAAGSEQGLSDVLRQVEGALSGQFRSLQTLRLNHHEIDLIRQGIAGARTEQEKMNRIAAVLAQHYGGAQAALTSTFNFARQQIPDIVEQIYATIGRAGLPILTQGINDFIDLLKEVLRDAEFMKILSDTFVMAAHAVTFAAKGMMTLVRAVVWLTKQMPAFPKLLTALILVGSTLLIVAGHVIAFAGAVMGVQAIIATLGASLAGVASTAAAVMAGVIAVGVILAGVFAVVSRAWERDFGGIRSLFERVSLVVRGLAEAFQNWGDGTTTISMETANALAEVGLLDFFQDLIVYAGRAERWFTAFWKEMQAGYRRIAPDLEQLNTAFTQLFRAIGQGFVQISGAFNGRQTTSQFAAMEKGGTDFATSLLTVVIPVVRAFVGALTLIANVMTNYVVPAVVSVINWWSSFQKENGAVITALTRIGRLLMFVFGAAMVSVISIFMATIVAVSGVVASLVAIFTALSSVFTLVTDGIGSLIDYLRLTFPMVDTLANGVERIFRSASRGSPQVTTVATSPGGSSTIESRTQANAMGGKYGATGLNRANEFGGTVEEYLAAPASAGGAGSAGTGKLDVAGGERSHREDAARMERGNKVQERAAVAMEALAASIKGGGLRPVIEGEPLAGAVRGADEDAGARLGRL